jgi:hypothetical protein
MSTVSIAIGTNDGKNFREHRRENVECRNVAQFFAVHRDLGLTRNWQITHRPTGFRARGGFKTRREALEFAEWLQKRGKRAGVDWALADVKKLSRGKPWKELSAAVAKKIKAA